MNIQDLSKAEQLAFWHAQAAEAYRQLAVLGCDPGQPRAAAAPCAGCLTRPDMAAILNRAIEFGSVQRNSSSTGIAPDPLILLELALSETPSERPSRTPSDARTAG